MPDARQDSARGLASLSLTLSAVAEDALVTDVGHARQAAAEKVFPEKRAYSLGPAGISRPAPLRRPPICTRVFV